jgi:DNA replication and repair protein RecF
VRVARLWLTDFRNYTAAEAELAPGLTVVVGRNGEGKTSLLEGIGYLATLSSFRGVPTDALVRSGAPGAVVRAEGERDSRPLTVEAEIPTSGRGRVLVNHQPLRRARELLGALRITVFSPDDLELVKSGPSGRRRYLDDALVSLHPKHDALRADVDRVLRQRTTLLRQSGGRLTTEIATTLDVWDAQLVEHGEALVAARLDLLQRLEPELTKAYAGLAGGGQVSARYEASWPMDAGLAAAVAASRTDDVRRGVTLVGPHRDEIAFAVDGLPARTHASQGEQRSLALALRLAAHAVVREATGEPPVLLLDDVFSELDAGRSHALVDLLPAGQAVLTTAGPLPEGAEPERVIRVEAGRLS